MSEDMTVERWLAIRKEAGLKGPSSYYPCKATNSRTSLPLKVSIGDAVIRVIQCA